MNHFNFKGSRATYSIKHSFNLIFKKIETLLFSFLCIIFLIVAKVDSNFSKDVSFVFISVSMPVVKFAAFPFNTAIDLFTNFSELVDAKKENEVLKRKLRELKSFYIKSLNIYQENKELKNVLNFVTSKSSSYKVVRIIGYSHRVFNQKIFVNAGKDLGLKEGAIVTGTHGVIGRVSEVFQDKSRLILLSDANSKIPVITSKSRVRGILSGNNSDLMEILYLPRDHKIKMGDMVFTSGDGDSLPPGLLVGVVKKVTEKSAFITMIENVNNTNVVTIMNY